MHGLQGPIDDAFMDSFVFVRPTGTAAVGGARASGSSEQADYAISEWVHFFRGEPRVKHDTDVTAADIAHNNLALFGDPSSNAVYKRIAGRLPIRWTADGVIVGGETFSSDHAPVFIFPNPLNPAEVRRHQQRLHVSRSVQQRHAVAQAAGLGGRRHHQAGQQLQVPAAVRRIAGVLRRGMER